MRVSSSRLVLAACVVAAVSFCVPHQADAQGAPEATLTRTEVGGHFTMLLFGVGGGGTFTWNFNERHAIQTGADYALRPATFLMVQPVVSFEVQYRLTLRVKSARTRVFVTAGGLGAALRTQPRAIPQVAVGPDGRIIVLIGHLPPARFELAPVFAAFGGGVEHRLSQRISVRGDAGIAFHRNDGLIRFSGGLTVALGAPIARR